MTRTTAAGFDLAETYVHLEDGGAAALVDVTPTFWAELVSGEVQSEDVGRVADGGGWLVTTFEAHEDTKTWEMHPVGDEILVLREGAVDIVFEHPEGEHVVELREGAACLVPRGVWHRFVVRAPSRIIGITYGEGTRHRPV